MRTLTVKSLLDLSRTRSTLPSIGQNPVLEPQPVLIDDAQSTLSDSGRESDFETELLDFTVQRLRPVSSCGTVSFGTVVTYDVSVGGWCQQGWERRRVENERASKREGMSVETAPSSIAVKRARRKLNTYDREPSCHLLGPYPFLSGGGASCCSL
jgi:hypothetical protein